MAFEARLPLQTAEASLYRTGRHYRSARVLDPANGTIRPSQLMPPPPRLCYICCPEFGLGPCRRVCHLWALPVS
jgi:hypothetical protein